MSRLCGYESAMEERVWETYVREGYVRAMRVVWGRGYEREREI